MKRALFACASGVAGLAACATEPGLVEPHAAAPAVCARANVAGMAGASDLSVAVTPGGATVAWVEAGGVMHVDLDGQAHAAVAPSLAWPGAYDRAFAATEGDRVVIGATSGDTTAIVAAPFGIGSYRELAILGGLSGAAPVVSAGGTRLAPSVWYGGLLVSTFDEQWAPHTAHLAVLGPAATELAATAVGDEALIAWPASGRCYLERAFDAATGTGWSEPGACNSPRLASVAGSVALAYETPDGVYLALAASPADLHPSTATLVAPLAHSPRLVAHGGAYWLAYLSADGTATAALISATGDLSPTSLGAASTLELAVFGDAPHALTTSPTGLTASALCAE